jgi:N-acyl-D-aspartate/D-glutamate deacylase
VPPVASANWAAVMKLPTMEARLAALHDDATRADLIADGKARGLWYDAYQVHSLGNGDTPDFHIDGGLSVGELADQAGVHPVEIMVDRLIESQGRELFNVWFFNRNHQIMGDLLTMDHVYPGLGDAGAHAGQICDADAPTHYLSYWCRDRKAVSLPKAVHQLTQQGAQVLGLIDRGTLTVGAFADVNVFDPERLNPAYPDFTNDIPGGKGRLFVRSFGYAATLVNGQVVVEQGEHTGARPGQVLREFARA